MYTVIIIVMKIIFDKFHGIDYKAPDKAHFFPAKNNYVFVAPAFSMAQYRDLVFRSSVNPSIITSTLSLTLMFKFISQEL